MIIKAFEIDKLKKKNEKFFLLYGENEGLKNQLFQEVFAKNFENKLERFEENEILNNFDNFISSIINKSFFDESKLILIQRTTDRIIKLIDDLLDKNITDVTIVFNAGILEKKSKLRSKFEKEKTLICVPFYKDDIKTLRQVANNFFIKNKISLSQEVVNLIVERSSGDRINLMNELEKISLFVIDKKKINIEDVIKLTKAQIAQAKKDAKASKEKEEAEAKAAKEAAERTPEDDLEEQKDLVGELLDYLT